MANTSADPQPRPVPALLRDRAALSAEEFAARHFAESELRARLARELRERLERLSGLDLSGLGPDDTLGDLLAGQPLLAALEPAAGTAEGKGLSASLAGEIARALGKVLLQQVMGPAAVRCAWDLSTLRHRSIRGLVDEIERLERG